MKKQLQPSGLVPIGLDLDDRKVGYLVRPPQSLLSNQALLAPVMLADLHQAAHQPPSPSRHISLGQPA